MPTVSRTYRAEGAARTQLGAPRVGLVTERVGATPTELVQQSGPFEHYRRTLRSGPDHAVVETIEYRLRIPWFGWLFAIPVRAYLRRAAAGPADTDHTEPPPQGEQPAARQPGATQPGPGQPDPIQPGAGQPAARPPAARQPVARQPWWAPPDQLDARQAAVLGLLAAAAMASAFTNTLFTQTATFAADSFGVGDSGVGVAGAVVRAGIVIAIPLGMLADRWGRRRVIRWVAWSAPLVCSLGALAPNYPVLVATQTLGRPLGLALDLLIAVVAAEEMPRNSRAYAISVMAMASGLGAGIAVMALPLADLDIGPGGDDGWRLVYVVTLIWLSVAVSLTRHLPETVRFERPHRVAPPLDKRRLGLIAVALTCGNLFVAPASFFQNRYLNDVRGLSATMVAVFTLCTATPAALGLVAGGRVADVRGRRGLIAVTLPLATLGILASFYVDGAPMWVTAFAGGLLGGVAYPALAVYRAELFPTGNRGRANALLTTAALGGGIVGILLVGQLTDGGGSYGEALTLVAVGQLVVVVLVLTKFPETAHRELEDLNPEDAAARRSP